jgi:hypothetical protein
MRPGDVSDRVKIIVPSRKRSDTIVGHTLRLIPDAIVLVDEVEQDDYEPIVRKGRLWTHPSIQPMPAISNWVFKSWEDDPSVPWYGEKAIALCGDDTIGFFALPGWSSRRYDDPDVLAAVVANAANCAIDAGAYLFGFAANPNPIIYEPSRPLKLGRWIGSPFGLVRGHGLEADVRLPLTGDVDFCLQALLKHRIIWCDSRFATAGLALTNKGGSQHLRSQEQYDRERAILAEKWGQYIRFDTEAVHSSKRYKMGLPALTLQTYVHVPRTQPGF